MPYDRWHLGRRIAPLPFVAFAVVLATLAATLTPILGAGRGAMVAFDVAVVAFLVASVPVLRRAPADIRRTATDNDANRSLLLGLTVLVMLVVLVAVHGELQGRGDRLAALLVIATLALAWLFTNLVYAFHYAHLFYVNGEDGRRAGGLCFPATDRPSYPEFIYFSFTLGMTFQTSDVAVEATRMRMVVTGHCLAAFVFNLGVLAFTINVLGGG